MRRNLNLKVMLIKKKLRIEEFYTLEELEDLENQSMAYIARKFSNIRFNEEQGIQYKAI